MAYDELGPDGRPAAPEKMPATTGETMGGYYPSADDHTSPYVAGPVVDPTTGEPWVGWMCHHPWMPRRSRCELPADIYHRLPRVVAEWDRRVAAAEDRRADDWSIPGPMDENPYDPPSIISYSSIEEAMADLRTALASEPDPDSRCCKYREMIKSSVAMREKTKESAWRRAREMSDISATPPADPTDVLISRTPPPADPPPAAAAARATRPALDGMTVRDHLAAAALTGLLAAHSGEVELPAADKAARWAQEYADALLVRLADHPFGI